MRHQIIDNIRQSGMINRPRRLLARSAPAKPVLDTPRPVLSPPLVTLFVSKGNPQESWEAFGSLSESRTGFCVKLASDDQLAAEFAGATQYGIDGVRKLARALLQFERNLIPAGDDPTIDRMRRTDIQTQAEHELACQVEAARSEMDRLLA